MTPKTLNYYQLEHKERAAAAKWERRTSALCTFMLLFVFAGIVFLCLKNIEMFVSKVETSACLDTVPQSTYVTEEVPFFPDQVSSKEISTDFRR